jgi:hypothetical protein
MLRGYRSCVEGIFLKLTVEKGAFDRLWRTSDSLAGHRPRDRSAGTTAGAQKSRCAQLGCRVSGQAADQNNISRIVSWEIDNGARHGEMVQSD